MCCLAALLGRNGAMLTKDGSGISKIRFPLPHERYLVATQDAAAGLPE